jgi:ppGpp synthetase/RelA/SpoT-type nucleotidyltranferase
LLDLQPEDVQQLLGMFQSAVADEPQTFQLVETINSCQERQLSEAQLRTIFDKFWPDLKQKLNAIAAADKMVQPKRDVRDMVAEILAIARKLQATSTQPCA